MSIKPEALAGHLAKGLPAITWIHGDEALIVIEATDTVRSVARKYGFEERIVMHVDRHFAAEAIASEANALSLFASRKLIDIRFAAKPSRDVTRAIAQLLAQGLTDDVRLLVSSARPEPALLRSAEFSAIDKNALVVQCFPVEHTQLAGWVSQRLAAQQQRASKHLLQLICERVEGNLLAASQEIRKLGLLFDQGELPDEQAAEAILEVSRYEAGDLVEAALAGDIARTRRSLDGLIGEGRAETLVIWHLAEAARAMQRLQSAEQAGEPVSQVMRRIRAFGPRQSLYQKAARRIQSRVVAQSLADAARADTIAKGFESGDPWPLVRRIALRLAGAGA